MTAPTNLYSSNLSETAICRHYTLRYLAAVLCIGATILVGAFQLNSILEINEQQAEIINIAGAQRMLSQRLALLTPRVINGETQSQRDRACHDLSLALERMEEGHRFLTEPRTTGLAPAEATPQLRAHYFGGGGIWHMVEVFLRTFREFVHEPEDNARGIDQFRIMAETSMLEELDEAVTLYAQAARQSTMSAIQTHGAWVLASILLLLLEVLFIFRPLARTAARTVSTMSSQLEERTATLSRSMQIAKMGHWRATSQNEDEAWISRELALLYGLDLDEGVVPVSVLRAHDIPDPNVPGGSALRIAFARIWQTGEPSEAHGRFRKPDGTVIDIAVDMVAECDSTGRVVAVEGVVTDITSEKQAARELEQLAYFDGLTGLANRTCFSRQIEQVCTEARDGMASYGLLLVDLDHFKEVNDGFGHAAGDELLSIIGQRLRDVVGDAHCVSRLGGDEFAVIVKGGKQAMDGKSLQPLCQKIIDAVGEMVPLKLGEAQVGASIGIAIAPLDSTDPDELMRFADLALYAGKQKGRGRAVHFTRQMNDDIGQRMMLANEMRHALEERRFETFFQPLVSLDDGKVHSFEALLRLPHPERGFIPPSEFIPIAESSHLIADLGAFVFTEACNEAKNWVDAGLPPRQVAVNVSAAQLWHGDLEQTIDDALLASGLDPALLCIELTESVCASESITCLNGLLNRLSERGIKLALDDFGTGYSSLSYLNQLPFDKLKIDRSFVANVDACTSRHKLLQGIVSLGHGLGMEVVAEGVETRAELEIVRALGCDTVQGWYYAKAQSSAQAASEAARIEGLAALAPIRNLIDASAIKQNGKIQAA